MRILSNLVILLLVLGCGTKTTNKAPMPNAGTALPIETIEYPYNEKTLRTEDIQAGEYFLTQINISISKANDKKFSFLVFQQKLKESGKINPKDKFKHVVSWVQEHENPEDFMPAFSIFMPQKIISFEGKIKFEKSLLYYNLPSVVTVGENTKVELGCCEVKEENLFPVDRYNLDILRLFDEASVPTPEFNEYFYDVETASLKTKVLGRVVKTDNGYNFVLTKTFHSPFRAIGLQLKFEKILN